MRLLEDGYHSLCRQNLAQRLPLFSHLSPDDIPPNIFTKERHMRIVTFSMIQLFAGQ
jgi:hypothetical protein